MDAIQLIEEGLRYTLIIPPVLGFANRLITLGRDVSLQCTGKVDKKQLARLKNFFQYEEIQIGDSTVRMAGVSHVDGYYEQHKATLDDLIDKSDIIVSEDNPGKRLDIGDGKFYGNLSDRYAEKNKLVMNFDPRGATLRAVLSFSVMEASQCVFGLLGAITNLDITKLTVTSIVGRAISYYLCASSLHSVTFFKKYVSSNCRYYYNSFDFSNVLVAEGLSRLSKCHKNIGVIYGSNHIDEIKYYVDHPHIRSIKKALYAPYRLLTGSPQVESRYQGGWVKVQKRALAQ